MIAALPLRLDLVSHSATGFDWGHNGAGAAQLALAMLADHLGDDEQAIRHHQAFKRRVVAALGDDWTLTSSQVQLGIDDSES